MPRFGRNPYRADARPPQGQNRSNRTQPLRRRGSLSDCYGCWPHANSPSSRPPPEGTELNTRPVHPHPPAATHSRYPPPHSRYPPPRPASPPPPPTYHPTAWAAEQVLDSAHQPVIPSEEIMIQHPDDFGTVHRQSLEDRIPQPTSRWSTITGFPQRSDTVRRPLPQLHWLEQGFEAGGDQASTRSGALSDDEARGGPATSIHHNEEMRGSPLRSHPSVSSSESNGSRGTMDPDAFVSPGLGRTNRLSSHLPPSHSPHGHRPSHHSDERPPPVPRKNSRRYPSQPGRASSHSSTPRNIGSSSTELLQPQRTNESGFDSRQGPLDDMPAFVPEHDSDNEGLHRR